MIFPTLGSKAADRFDGVSASLMITSSALTSSHSRTGSSRASLIAPHQLLHLLADLQPKSGRPYRFQLVIHGRLLVGDPAALASFLDLVSFYLPVLFKVIKWHNDLQISRVNR